MRQVLFFSSAFVLSMFFTALAGFVLWPLVILGVLFLKQRDSLTVYVSALFFGIGSDLVSGFPVGVSSLVLLLFSWLLFGTAVRFRGDIKIVLIFIGIFELVFLVLHTFLPF